MPFLNTPKASAALTADGTATGYVTVADNTPFYPRAHVWMIDVNGNPVEYIVTDLVGTTKIGLQAVQARSGGAVYTRSDVSTWTVANASKISQDRQVVAVELSNLAKNPIL